MDELEDLRKGIRKPKLVGPHPFSFEELMRYTWPAPDEETERFLDIIHEGRRETTAEVSSE
jgi:hypothetical protein